MTIMIEAPAAATSVPAVADDLPVGEAGIFDAAGVPVTTIPDAWGAGELDHQQDFEDMVATFDWPDLDNFPEGPFHYPVY